MDDYYLHHEEYAYQEGISNPGVEWILTPWNVWIKNPHYDGWPTPHPEDYQSVEEFNSKEIQYWIPETLDSDKEKLGYDPAEDIPF